MTDRDNNTRFSGADARRIMRAAKTATLATRLDDGTPFASLVKVATAAAGQPVILISRLAWHTRNLEADNRASLLFLAEGGDGDPLENPRVTAIGRFAPCHDAALAARFLACRPDAVAYAGFKDFGFWRMEVERCQAIAGFGRIETLDGRSVVLPCEQAEAVARLAPESLDHMNEHHAEAIKLCAVHVLRQPATDWRAVELDPDGVELSDGKRSVRLAFGRSISTAAELKETLKALDRQVRQD
jgi:heme iron utilization protein